MNFRVWQSCHDVDEIEGVPRISARTVWYWAEKINGQYVGNKIHMPTVIEHNSEQPADSDVIVVDFEPFGGEITRYETLDQLLTLLKFYQEAYPGRTILPYRQVPTIDYLLIRDYIKSFDSNDVEQGQAEDDRFGRWREKCSSVLSKEVAQTADGLTCRAYMIYPGKFQEWVNVMDLYFSQAQSLGVPVWAYICRHYVGGPNPGRPVEPEIFQQAIDFCKYRWGCAGAINWVDTNNPTAQDPIYAEIIKRSNESSGKLELLPSPTQA